MNIRGTQSRRLLLPALICCLAAFPCLEQGGLASATSPAKHVLLDDTTTTCVPLQGIESNATETLDPSAYIDLDAIMESLAEEPFHPDNPIIPAVAGCAAYLETPISMRNLLEIDTSAFSVSSVFHTNNIALDIFGDKETTDARRRCQPDADDEDAQLLYDLHLRVAIVYTVVYAGIQAMPYCEEELEILMEERGHPLSLIYGDDLDSDTPWGLAKTYVDEVIAYMLANDGWNADGSKSREFNRIPFSDYTVKDSAGNKWTPYQPRNSPYKLTHRKRWQPLMESPDDLGYIVTQEHVTPHIGVTARFYGFDSATDEDNFASRQLDSPEYKSRYSEVAAEVLAESTITASDTYKQAAISFFDNKFGSLVPLKALYFVGHTDTLTNLDFYQLTVSVQLAIYNAVVLVWREKIRHDLPRPPTVVTEKFGDTLVQAYAGEDYGVQTMKASEWEPFIRTMPHSEFPSASSCLCQVFAEQVENFVGADEITPTLELGSFSFSAWSEISADCGDSRVWGGMHFEDAVPAGVELCGGGEMATSIAKTMQRLVDGDETAAVFDKNVGEHLLRPL